MSVSQLFQPNGYTIYCDRLIQCSKSDTSKRIQDASSTVVPNGTAGVPVPILTLPAVTLDVASTVDVSFVANNYFLNSAAPLAQSFYYEITRDGTRIGYNTFQSTAGIGSSQEFPMVVRAFDSVAAGTYVYAIRFNQVGNSGGESWTVTVREKTFEAKTV